MFAEGGEVEGNIFQHSADLCEHTEMKNTCTCPELFWSLFLGWNRFLPGTLKSYKGRQCSSRKTTQGGGHRSTRRRGKEAESLAGERHKMGMLASTMISLYRAGDALMESTSFESKPKT